MNKDQVIRAAGLALGAYAAWKAVQYLTVIYIMKYGNVS